MGTLTAAGAASKDLEIVRIPIRGEHEIEAAFDSRKYRVDALFITADGVLTPLLPRFAALALARRYPSVGQVHRYVEVGGLASYGPDSGEEWRNAAEYVDRILNGAKAGDLPFIQASRLELYLNRTTASALGITIPQDLLLRAKLVVD